MNYICEAANKAKDYFFGNDNSKIELLRDFPTETIEEVCSHLFLEILSLALVSKKFNAIVNKPSFLQKAITEHKLDNPKEWAFYFGNDVKLNEINRIFKSACFLFTRCQIVMYPILPMFAANWGKNIDYSPKNIMDLPREVKDEIYSYLIDEDKISFCLTNKKINYLNKFYLITHRDFRDLESKINSFGSSTPYHSNL